MYGNVVTKTAQTEKSCSVWPHSCYDW